jgi:hypothetical protein
MAEEILDSSSFAADILEFLSLLHRHQVRYLIVGGEAVIYYGHARLTGHIDIFYEATDENARRMFAALQEFWQGDVPDVARFEELTEPGVIVQFGRPPQRIDLINQIDGVTFGAAWPNRKTVEVRSEGSTIPIYYIGLRDLIRNKEACRRAKELDDLEYLRRQEGQK